MEGRVLVTISTYMTGMEDYDDYMSNGQATAGDTCQVSTDLLTVDDEAYHQYLPLGTGLISNH